VSGWGKGAGKEVRFVAVLSCRAEALLRWSSAMHVPAPGYPASLRPSPPAPA
jgi:hypothetical protein